MYGGTRKAKREALSRPGLSPRVRGNRRVPVVRGGVYRSIPACTGEPLRATTTYE